MVIPWTLYQYNAVVNDSQYQYNASWKNIVSCYIVKQMIIIYQTFMSLFSDFDLSVNTNWRIESQISIICKWCPSRRYVQHWSQYPHWKFESTALTLHHLKVNGTFRGSIPQYHNNCMALNPMTNMTNRFNNFIEVEGNDWLSMTKVPMKPL